MSFMSEGKTECLALLLQGTWDHGIYAPIAKIQGSMTGTKIPNVPDQGFMNEDEALWMLWMPHLLQRDWEYHQGSYHWQIYVSKTENKTLKKYQLECDRRESLRGVDALMSYSRRICVYKSRIHFHCLRRFLNIIKSTDYWHKPKQIWNQLRQ